MKCAKLCENFDFERRAYASHAHSMEHWLKVIEFYIRNYQLYSICAN